MPSAVTGWEWCDRNNNMPCKWLFPLPIGAISDSDGNVQVLTKPNGISYLLPLLPGMAPTASEKDHLVHCSPCSTYCATLATAYATAEWSFQIITLSIVSSADCSKSHGEDLDASSKKGLSALPSRLHLC